MSGYASAPSPRPRRQSIHVQAAAKVSTRHRLDVLAVSVSDVIRCAGGWLADRALAGWDVNVFVPEVDGVTPMRILGVSVHRLADIGGADPDMHTPTAVAISADAVCADRRIKVRLDAELARGVAELTVWGPQIPGDMGAYLQPVQHIPSAAAAAFKTHALRAAGLGAGVHTVEIFRTGLGNNDCPRPRLAAVRAAECQALPAAAVWAPVSAHTD